MGQKIVVGPLNKGLRNDITPFNVDNDSFPVLLNAYQWRGRVKRKRGTTFLGRLTRTITSVQLSAGTFGTSGSYADLLNDPNINIRSSQPNASIVPGTLSIVVGAITFTDNGQGVLVGTPGTNSGTINYSSGFLTFAFSPAIGLTAVVVTFNYYPTLPVMGLEDFVSASTEFPGTIGFDTIYSYNISPIYPYAIKDVSFYKNPPASVLLPGYVQKSPDTATTWNGQDYQQFWTVNYQGALWATNGITIPFSITNIGMQYKPIVAVTVTSGGPPAIVNLQITGHGLVVGDFLFINEVLTTTGINWQTGYVIAVVDANNVTVEFPNATIATNGTGGIAQYLTNRSSTTVDSLRWYDGDPTTTNNGWVNFSPPLSQSVFSIADEPSAIYYLVGARMIVPFKDRLLFIGPVIQSSAAGSQVYLQDTVIYSQNGTPYYTASYTNSPNAAIDNPVSPTNIYHPILVPDGQTATPNAYFEDQTGFGGFITAGIDQKINTESANGDVLILGFDNLQMRFVYSGNDLVPFNFFIINSELGSSSTFSSINQDKGVITRGDHGFIITAQTEAGRIDIPIPDEVFQIRLLNNGTERVTAQRDYENEWIYITYPVNDVNYKFPTQTLQYNYRDDSWAIFRESYTHYGQFRKLTGQTWATLPSSLTWKSWNVPWNSGSNTLLQPDVIAGNQQGFVVFRDDEGTNESNSLAIQNIVGSLVTSPDHCLSAGDYITMSGVLGTVGTLVNGLIFSVGYPITANTFTLNPALVGTGTYLGGGLIKRMYVPFIQTKQFPVAWDMARKTRIGTQQYLFTTTSRSQIQLLIYLSQNADSAYNQGNIVPNTNVVNRSLIYSTVLYTCPESANLGLTPTNTNLQMISDINQAGTNASSPQAQIWHRMNTSLIGDTVQIGFTLSDAQMRDINFVSQFSEIELHGMILDVSPSSLLA